MTAEQLWEAKVIVLDLLGWGVPPSHLLECGLSREAIYYVFTELELKLPPGFEQPAHPSAPFPPLELVQFPTGLPVQHSALEAEERPSGHFEKPLPTTTSHSTQPNVSSSLLEMEQMRRKELLARKAVLASRRQKLQSQPIERLPPETTGDNIQGSDEIVSPVNDFLQSIAPPEPRNEVGSRATPPSENGPADTEAPQSGLALPQFLGQRSDSFRRSAKRPVASDFVDAFDYGETMAASVDVVALPSDFLGDDAKSGPPTPTNVLLPQATFPKEPTFNKVSVIRRCIIDFSDDEDDTSDADRIKSDIALVKAKEEEIRKLRERIERYKGKQRREGDDSLVEPGQTTPEEVEMVPVAHGNTAMDEDETEDRAVGREMRRCSSKAL